MHGSWLNGICYFHKQIVEWDLTNEQQRYDSAQFLVIRTNLCWTNIAVCRGSALPKNRRIDVFLQNVIHMCPILFFLFIMCLCLFQYLLFVYRHSIFFNALHGVTFLLISLVPDFGRDQDFLCSWSVVSLWKCLWTETQYKQSQAISRETSYYPIIEDVFVIYYIRLDMV